MNIVIIGKGRMGQLLKKEAEKRGHSVLGMADLFDPAGLEENVQQADLILDFSHPDNLSWILETIKGSNTALVEGTTSFSNAQLKQLEEAAEKHPVFFSANYSLGIAVLKDLVEKAAQVLSDKWDMELVETHHNQKADAPSGTALALLEAMDPDNTFEHVFGRQGITGKRGKEIGIHALRGGSVPGDHEVLFLGPDEKLELKHSAGSRQIFVSGALDAAEFLEGKAPSLYSMKDLVA